LYDLIFCYSKDLINEIKERFNHKIQLVHLPFGYEIPKETQQRADAMDLEIEEVRKLCFIGGPDNELRFQLLSELIKRDLPIDIYGLGWNKYFGKTKKNFKVFTGVYGEDYWLTLKRYRAQINIFRPHNINSHNMRSFEIPAIGGIQLAPDSIEHREYFQADKEIKLYTSLEELEAISLNILQMGFEEANIIRLAATERSRNSHYSYQERANTVLMAFHKMLDEK
jgi:spore maturation protein CgeB